MTRKVVSELQMSLLDWEPPAPVQRFDEALVRAPTIAGRVSRAVATSLSETGHSRAEIAQRMSVYLGAAVSTNMVNAYARAREDHSISVPRYMALTHATGDRRLVELLAAPNDWAVIERRYLVQIELADLSERQDDLRRRGDTLRRLARARR